MALLSLGLVLGVLHTTYAQLSPRETTVADDELGLDNGWTPKPTSPPIPPPRFAGMRNDLLFKRQDENPQTCGWFWGNADYPITCGTDVCAYYNTADPPGFLCCPTASGNSASLIATYCAYTGSCRDYQASNNPYSGASEYMSNSDGILSCGSNSPYCFTIANADDEGNTWYAWGCDANGGYYKASMFVTATSASNLPVPSGAHFSSAGGGGTTQPPTVPATTQPPSSGGGTTNPPSSAGGTSEPKSSSSPSSYVPPPPSSTNPPSTTAPPPPSSSSDHSTQSSTTYPSIVPGSGTSGNPTTLFGPSSTASGGAQSGGGGGGSGKSSTNVGAIAGGTVGGVAAVALIGAAVGYLWYRKRKQRVEPMPEISQYNTYGYNY